MGSDKASAHTMTIRIIIQVIGIKTAKKGMASITIQKDRRSMRASGQRARSLAKVSSSMPIAIFMRVSLITTCARGKVIL
jgi:hypothetical protein